MLGPERILPGRVRQRVATKVMQTALAVRHGAAGHRHPGLRDHLFRDDGGRLRRLDAGALLGWMVLYAAARFLVRAAPGQVAQNQADAPFMMTGRITPTPTPTSPPSSLFSHANRPEGRLYARRRWRTGVTVHRQMRMVIASRSSTTLSMALDPVHPGMALWLWDEGPGGRGCGGRGGGDGPAPERHLALEGCGRWPRCSSTSAPCRTASTPLAKPRTAWSTAPGQALKVSRSEIRFGRWNFQLRPQRRTVADASSTAPDHPALARRSAWWDAPGQATDHHLNLLLRFYDVAGGPHPHRQPGHRHRDARLLRAQVGMVTQGHLAAAPLGARPTSLARPDAGDADMVKAAEPEARLGSSGPVRPLKGQRGIFGRPRGRTYGVKLSGGQRQRIAIARVMLRTRRSWCSTKRPTRSTPRPVEAAIQERTSYSLMEGKTGDRHCHCLSSTIAALDCLVVMDAGRIVDKAATPSCWRKRHLTPGSGRTRAAVPGLED